MSDIASPSGSRGICTVPRSFSGRASVIMLLVVFTLIAVNVAFFDAPNEAGPAWLGAIVRAAIGLAMLTALITGAIALIRKRECSWVVWLSTALGAVVLTFELIEILSTE